MQSLRASVSRRLLRTCIDTKIGTSINKGQDAFPVASSTARHKLRSPETKDTLRNPNDPELAQALSARESAITNPQPVNKITKPFLHTRIHPAASSTTVRNTMTRISRKTPQLHIATELSSMTDPVFLKQSPKHTVHENRLSSSDASRAVVHFVSKAAACYRYPEGAALTPCIRR